VAEVELRGWTTDGLLRHASFKGLRDDKDAPEVVREAAARSSGKAALRPTIPTISRLTHPDRVLWPDVGLTKQGLAEYYADIAGWALPHLADRPLSLVRCPSGVGKDCFFQKHAWEGIGSEIGRRTIQDEEVLFIRDLEGLVALVQAGVLEIHPWGSTIGNPERPDRITIDLDPGEDVAWTALIEGACEVRERLRVLGLESFVKTTGGKGLHVVVPLTPKAEWEEVKRFAQELADAMARDTPQRYVATSALRERKGRIYVDYLRNGRGATAVGAYSPRARAGAPVSTPLGWDELSPNLRPSHFRVDNLPTRLRHLAQDPWADIGRLDQVLPGRSSARRRRRA
jgi:bifunctional non-homologous end joining protein LigD